MATELEGYFDPRQHVEMSETEMLDMFKEDKWTAGQYQAVIVQKRIRDFRLAEDNTLKKMKELKHTRKFRRFRRGI